MKRLDPNSNGSIAFDVFVDYMTRELTDLDTSDQLLQSFRTISGEKVSAVGRLQITTSVDSQCYREFVSLSDRLFRIFHSGLPNRSRFTT